MYGSTPPPPPLRASQSTFRSLEMHSKRRYKICTLTHSFSILQGFQSENFRCSLTYCESENFSDSSLHQIKLTPKVLGILFCTKITWPGRWNVQKLTSENRIGNFIHLYFINIEICTWIKRSSRNQFDGPQVIENCRQYLPPWTYILQKTSHWMPLKKKRNWPSFKEMWRPLFI